MKILIPSTGRADRVKTIKSLGEAGRQAIIVVAVGEGAIYRDLNPSNTVIESPTHGIRAKRQWMLDNFGTSKMTILDDDLVFRKRIDQSHFAEFDGSDGQMMINTISDYLDRYAHVGIADRFMIQETPRGYVEGRRYNQVLAYNPLWFPSPWPSFRVEVNEEHDFHLQLRAAGLKPCVMTEYTKQDKAYAAGGCATWRTADSELEAHRKFQEFWPDLVSIVPNKNAISGFVTRIKWKQVDK